MGLHWSCPQRYLPVSCLLHTTTLPGSDPNQAVLIEQRSHDKMNTTSQQTLTYSHCAHIFHLGHTSWEAYCRSTASLGETDHAVLGNISTIHIL